MVLDTSAVLAVCFEEEWAGWVLEQTAQYAGQVMMSTVNYTETLILVADRLPGAEAEFRHWARESSLTLVPPTTAQAEIAADARKKYPLNLGDCFAYALAKDEGVPLLALDSDFRKTDIKVLSPGKTSKQ